MARLLYDISDYDPSYAADDLPAGVIINVEARSLLEKAELAHAAGIPIMLYSWVYPGDNGYSVTRSYAAAELLRLHDIHVVHHWLDYEQSGTGPQNLEQAGRLLQSDEAPVGTYTYLAVLPSVRHAIVGPLWLAYYPHGYEYVDYYEAMSNTARSEGAVIHQFTSVAPPDGRDMNAVLADRWFDIVILSVAPSAPAPREPEDLEEVNMKIVTNSKGKSAAFIRQGSKLWIRGFDQGSLQGAALLSDQCDPQNLSLAVAEAYGEHVVYAVGKQDGGVVQCMPGPFGPVVSVV
jgi:hypothetical protein